MALDVKVMRHPTRQQLVAYVESLVDRRVPVSAALAGHVNACRQCAAEVRQIRGSFEFADSASPLEPSTNLTAQILLEAKKTRQTQDDERRRRSPWSLVAQGVGCMAGVALVAFSVFSMALEVPGVAGATPQVYASAPESAEAAIKDASDQIKTLSSAVRVSEASVRNPREREWLRAVGAMGTDIAAAKAALERNPGCVRAAHIVNANIERGARTLRDLYVEQAL
ncbi:MAG: hypothetical protein HYV26_09935 [Candidatus Hydrogenedentes bacterium]|nr:hypothetical protein [Candidatus Hydrogenedentota bacterium]